MSLTLEFVIGAPEAIRIAVATGDLDALEDPTIIKAKADMSFHLTPHDLDILSEEFAAASGRAPIELRPHLRVLSDDSDAGALLVDREWISYVAGVPANKVGEVAETWTTRMRLEYKDPEIVLTDDLLEAVRGLVAICERAKSGNEALVHLWNL